MEEMRGRMKIILNDYEEEEDMRRKRRRDLAEGVPGLGVELGAVGEDEVLQAGDARPGGEVMGGQERGSFFLVKDEVGFLLSTLDNGVSFRYI